MWNSLFWKSISAMTSQALLVCLDFSSSLLFILALFFPSHPCSFIPCLPLLPSFLPSCLKLSPCIHLCPTLPVFPCSSCSSLCLCLFFVFFLPNTFLWPCTSYPMAPLFFSKSFTSCQSTLFPISGSFMSSWCLSSWSDIFHYPPPPHTHTHTHTHKHHIHLTL